MAITSGHLHYFHMFHLVYHAWDVFPSLLYLAAQSTLIIAAPSKDLGTGRRRREGRRKEEKGKREKKGGGRGRREREEEEGGEKRKEKEDTNITYKVLKITCNNLKAGMTKMSGAILWYDVLTSPSSVSATVCIPPQVTWITLLLARGPPTGNGFFLSITSSPRPSCPTSPWPSIITWGGVRCEGMGGLKRDLN